jgi:hypothetical protein
LLADEGFELVASERFERPPCAGGELREHTQVTSVAFEGVIGEAPFDAQMIEERFDGRGHGDADGYATIRGLFEVV